MSDMNQCTHSHKFCTLEKKISSKICNISTNKSDNIRQIFFLEKRITFLLTYKNKCELHKAMNYSICVGY